MNVAGKSDVSELVGRGQELGRLLALLEDARAGHGRAALVLGEAGIGKTRLTEAFAAAAALAEIRVAWGRCTDAESPAYWPWRQLLRSLHGSIDQPGAHHGWHWWARRTVRHRRQRARTGRRGRRSDGSGRRRHPLGR